MISIGTLKDYTESLKQHIPEGQKISLWEQFLTGTSQQYQTLTQQAQDVYAYDISQAYANYKQQQLQLQMNQQLGEGFKQQVGSQLQSQYGSAFSDIKTQEASALLDIEQKRLGAIEKGEKEFTTLGKQAQTLDKLLIEFSKAGDNSISQLSDEEMYTTDRDESGREIKTLTDAGRLWYYNVFNRPDLNFQDWLLSEDSLSTIDLEDRQAIADALAGENRNLLLESAAGIGGLTTKDAEELKSTSKNKYVDSFRKGLDNKSLTDEQKTSLIEQRRLNPEFISFVEPKKFVFDDWGTTFTDDYGQKWYREQTTPITNVTSSSFKQGDIIQRDGKYYLVNIATRGKYHLYPISKK